MPDFKKKRNIVHLVEWIVAIIAALALADIFCFNCGKHHVENQFICGTVYGYLIVTSLLFLAICLDEEIPEKTGYAVSALGAALYLVVTILLAIYYNDVGEGMDDRPYFSLLIGLVFCFANFVIFTIEFFLSLLKKDALE